MALGAGRGQVVWLVLRDGFVLAAAGIAGGMALAFGAGRLVAGQLTGVSGADPLSFAGHGGAAGGRGRRAPASCRRAGRRRSIR